MAKMAIGFVLLCCLTGFVTGCGKFDSFREGMENVSEQIQKEQKEALKKQITEFENIVHVENASIANVVDGSYMDTYIVQYTDGKKVWEAYYKKNKLLTVVEVGKVIYYTK